MYDTIEIMPANYGWGDATHIPGPDGFRGMVIHVGGKCKQLDNGMWTTETDVKTPNRAAIYVALENIAIPKKYYTTVANYCEDV